MRSLLASVMAAFLLVQTGCTSSINPFYTDEDLIFDRALVGTWTDPDGEETWEFFYCGDKEYKLIHTDEKGKKGEFEARLVKIGSGTFLDLTPIESAKPGNDFFRGHFLTIHSVIRVFRVGDTYQIAYLEPEWLKKTLAGEPGAVRHAAVGNDIVLTDTTKNLQKFLAANTTTPGAFSEPVTVKRKEAAK